MSLKCGQCGKPAIGNLGDNPICVDCYYKLQMANYYSDISAYTFMNYLSDQMGIAVGLPGLMPKIEIPRPVLQRGQMNFNNIKVEKSVVGSINTGNVHTIDVAMNYINNQGNEELTKAIREFTEAVLNENSIESKTKNEIIEKLSFIAQQAILPKGKHNPSVLKTILNSIKDLLTSAASAVTIISSWDKLQTLFEKIFF